jgi:hypothetical protein
MMNVTDTFDLDTVLKFPLIAENNTRIDLSPLTEYNTGGSVYFGTGLATPKAFTVGLPFDYLSMLTTAEFLRRSIGADRIIQEISDTHCIQNGVASTEEIYNMAAKQKLQVEKVAYNLGISEQFKCILASDYQSSADYDRDREKILASSQDPQNHYFIYQWTGDYYLTREENIKVKLGWATDDNLEIKGLDERSFNRGYKNLGLPGPCYAYTFGAYNFDSQRPRVSPYTCLPQEKRLMLAYEDNATEMLTDFLDHTMNNPNLTRRAIGRLALITQSFEEVFGTVQAPTPLSHKKEDFSSGLVELSSDDAVLMGGPCISIPYLGEKIDAIRCLIS